MITDQQRDPTQSRSAQRRARDSSVQPAPDVTSEAASPAGLTPARDVLSRQLARAVQLRVGVTAGPLLMRGPHDKGYYKATGNNGIVYYRFCKKRSDDQETSFKQEVIHLAGGIAGSVQYPVKQPPKGEAI